MTWGDDMNAVLSAPTCFVGKGGLFREGLRRVLADTPFAIERDTETLETLCKLFQEGFMPRFALVHAPRETAPDCAGIAKLCGAGLDLHVVILTDRASPVPCADLVHAGVDGILLKRTSAEALLHALKLILLGEKVFPKKLIGRLIERGVQCSASEGFEASGLSQREGEILTWLARGAPNKEIARQLDITEATVKVHLKAILRKIGACNRTQAAIWALSHGAEAGSLDRPAIHRVPVGKSIHDRPQGTQSPLPRQDVSPALS
jgi:two-component system nitrate/nitrite response regulator NarL